MARDALSSGDPVLAENYLQHAEHYNRIIMAQREQQMSDDGRAANGAGRGRGGLHAPDDEGMPSSLPLLRSLLSALSLHLPLPDPLMTRE